MKIWTKVFLGTVGVCFLLLIGGAESIDSQPTSEDQSEWRELGTGMASVYHPRLAGNTTASGEPYDPEALTAAHRKLPFETEVRVTYLKSGKSVIVRINDRGPYHPRRVIDLSTAAAKKLGISPKSTARVRLELRPEPEQQEDRASHRSDGDVSRTGGGHLVLR